MGVANMKNENISRDHRSGIVLFAVMGIILITSLLAATLAVVSVRNVDMTASYKGTVDALFAADAGLQYVKYQIMRDLSNGSLALTNPVETVSYSATTGYSFRTVHMLEQTADPELYRVAITGVVRHSRAVVEALFKRGSFADLGLFADETLETKAYSGIYTYDSRVTHMPTPEDSLGGGLIGANGEMITYQDTLIDGSFTLGSDGAGQDGSWRESPVGGSIIYGEPAISVDRVDPDPLGIWSGDLAEEFDYYSYDINNSNGSASPPIPANGWVRISNQETNTLSAGNYYIDQITLNNSATLDIDASSGPVTIYLTGSFEAKEGSIINIKGAPTDLTIYCNATGPKATIILKHEGGFKGLIYAPASSVQIRNSGDFYGVAWARNIDIKNAGEVYVDFALTHKYPNNTIHYISWKEIR